jgi:hypothetical protein
MNRYRSYGERDDQPQVVGDGAFKGVDEYNAIENIAEGEVQQAVNMDFTSQDAVTRGGFVCSPSTSRLGNPIAFNQPYGATSSEVRTSVVYGNGIYVSLVLKSGPQRIQTAATKDLITTTLSTVSWPFPQYGTYSPSSNTPILFINGTFFLFLINSLLSGATEVYTSTDGLNWTQLSTFPTDYYYISSAWTSYDKIIVAFQTGASGNTLYYTSVSSDNGVTWTKSNSINPLGGLQEIVYYNGLFIACYSNLSVLNYLNSISYSLDGLTWYQSSLPVFIDDTLGSPIVPRISLGGSNFLLCYFGSDVYRSYDGINWQKTLSLPIPANYFDFVYYGGFFFIIINTTTTDGSITQRSIYSTIYGDNLVRRYEIPAHPSTSVLRVVNNLPLLFIPTGSSLLPTTIYQLLSPASALASTVYTDPNIPADQWIAVVGSDAVGFYASGKATRRVSLNGLYVTEQSTIVQCNNLVYIFRGPNVTPLYWNGDWSSTFQLAPTPTPPSGFQVIPNSNQATYYQNRLWVKKGKDEILASDVLDFNTYETITNSFNLNTGSSDYIVATFPFGDKTLLVFKNRSIIALTNVDGSLADVTATEVTRQVGLVGIRAVTSVGPDMAYVSYKNVNLITLTATNNSVQHKTLPLSFKIKKIMDRVNWDYAYKISLGYADNKLYVALPLDNSIFCNAVAVYNFVTGQWYGEWNFDGAMNMCIQDFQVANYLGLQKIHAVTEDGRIFVIGEGGTDISNQIYEPVQTGYVPSSYEIPTKLVTRAYDTSGLNHYQRRMFMDLATLRPSFSVVAYTEGASESSSLITDQTYSRSESWKFNDTPYDLTNVNDDYNRAYRKDYSTGGIGVQPQSGFEPEMLQEFRLPLMSTRQGRLSWVEITNTQGTINIMSAGFEARPGQRSNLVQV